MDPDRGQGSYDRTHDPSRVLALSDGVCAIIITLLVIEIHAPELGRRETLWEAMRELRPSLTAFLISFVVVAIAWVWHRDLFALIRWTDRGLVWLNVLYLLPLCLVPFGASLLANYGKDPVALRLYGLLLVAVARDPPRHLGVRDRTAAPSLRSNGFALPAARGRGGGGARGDLRLRNGDRWGFTDCEPPDLWSRAHPVLHHHHRCPQLRSHGVCRTRLHVSGDCGLEVSRPSPV